MPITNQAGVAGRRHGAITPIRSRLVLVDHAERILQRLVIWLGALRPAGLPLCAEVAAKADDAENRPRDDCVNAAALLVDGPAALLRATCFRTSLEVRDGGILRWGASYHCSLPSPA